MPLPAGKPCASIRKTREGGVALPSAEDRIDHTPKDETVTVPSATAFGHHRRAQADRLQEHSQLASGKWNSRSPWRNHKDSPITVEVNEPIGGDWEMLSSTYKVTKTPPGPPIPKCPSTKMAPPSSKYRIRAKWVALHLFLTHGGFPYKLSSG